MSINHLFLIIIIQFQIPQVISVTNLTNYYPIIPALTWNLSTPTNLSHVSCGINSLVTGAQYVEIDIQLPYYSKKKSGGYLCKRFNHRMTCITGWSGFSYKNTIEAAPISKEQCSEAISGYLKGDSQYTPLTFPSCEVLATRTTNNYRVDIEYLIVDLDKRLLSYVHHFFPGGKCNRVYCPTVHPNMFWISEDLNPPVCDELRKGKARILLDEYGKFSYSLIDTDYTPPLPIMSGCNGLSYCGHNSLRLETGFLIIPANDESKLQLSNVTKILPQCDQSSTFKELSEFEMTVTHKLHDILNYHRSQCERVIFKINNGQEIRQSDLIYLSPILGGPGVTFRIKNNTLIQFGTRWERVERFDTDCHNQTSCSIFFKKPGYSELFHLNTTKCEDPPPDLYLKGVRCMWYGGIAFGVKGLYYPHRHFISLIEEDYLEALDQGDTYIEPSANPDTDTEIDEDTDSEEGTTEYKSWLRLLRSYIVWIILGLLLILLVVLIIQFPCLLSCCCIRGNSGKDKQTNVIIELNPLSGLKDQSTTQTTNNSTSPKKTSRNMPQYVGSSKLMESFFDS